MNKLSIKVKDLSYEYSSKSTNLKVIDNVSFSVDRGGILGILGASGCGKSTLLKCVAGLLKPKSGYILINERPPKIAQYRKRIGIAFQEDSLLDWLNVKENIFLPLKIGRSLNYAHTYEKLIQIIGLKTFETFYPAQLSGGMRQRVILARALITNPEILLLDEPFSAIDMLTRTKLIIEFYNIIKALEITTILVTHSIDEAIFMSDELIVLDKIPTSILTKSKIEFNSKRDLNLFQNSDYLDKVSIFRNILMTML